MIMTTEAKLSSANRSRSSSFMKDRLSKLTQLHATSVAAIQTHIEFVPAKVPHVRRLQTLAVALWALLLPITLCLFLCLCTFPPLWPFIIVYMLWVHFWDAAPEHGGRSSQWFRSMRLWTYFAEYYPASMKKEQELPADRPYVFGYHPHGIIGMGALATFATESTGFSTAFPGIKPHLLTLASNFKMPIYRDILLFLGICSVSKQSCVNILAQGKGNAICIVVGGAAESLSAHPGTADLTLRRRLGFIKVAIQQGADLVPVFSFGENDIFQQMPNEKGTFVYNLQKKFQTVFGFTLPLFHGRGMLNYNLGLMPYRRRIVSVIGRPINVEKSERPTTEQIQAVQKLYIDELYRIWETYKDVFATDRRKELSIID
ncbi:DAGAT-domain-containing protein [Rickenella mellea]|uniref:Diacylglycerol O-acyltransferase n=1 Tax=Rickenella mellea TaxID=50990 RepID=A0A4Y7QA60_9AGAM|nr:DAGAT-domain-containing protein [Rickenella mellea]